MPKNALVRLAIATTGLLLVAGCTAGPQVTAPPAEPPNTDLAAAVLEANDDFRQVEENLNPLSVIVTLEIGVDEVTAEHLEDVLETIADERPGTGLTVGILHQTDTLVEPADLEAAVEELGVGVLGISGSVSFSPTDMERF